MRFITKIFLLSSATVAALIAGCAVGPDYHAEKVQVETNFSELNQMVVTNAPDAEWWKTFGDPELDKLISGAIEGNYDLKILSARLGQSRAQRNMAAADLFPQADADGGYAISRGSKNVILPLGGSSGASGGAGSGSTKAARDQNPGSGNSPGGASSSTSSSGTSGSSGATAGRSGGNNAAFDNQLSPLGKGGLPGATTELYQVGFDATWEIDIFGGKRRLVEAASADVRAAVENRRDMRLSVIAEVARDYFELRSLQARLKIAEVNLYAQKEILQLTLDRARSGLTTQADTARAAAEVDTTAATVPPLEAAMRQMVHAISTLLGKEPNALSGELETDSPLPLTPPQVPIGLPSQLVERRPDIRAAEARIRAANARIGNATADLFPKFALVGSAGLDASNAKNLFKWDSEYFLLSPTVAWRIFDAGRILSNIRLQKDIKEEMALEYRNTILQALRDVEDALVNYAKEHRRNSDLQGALQQNRLALQLAQSSYENGLSTFLDVLDAERSYCSSQDAVAQSELSLTTDLIALYKSLGGGWK